MRRAFHRHALLFFALLAGPLLAAAEAPGTAADLGDDWAAVEQKLAELGPADSTEVLAWIEIPRVQVSGPVLEGVDDVTIRRAVGHFPETPWPGEGGNVALAAHRTTVFRGLRDISTGDRIRITRPEGFYEYIVASMRVVEPSEVWVLRPIGREALTLITCFPFDYSGNAPQRFVVRAAAANPTPDETPGL